ncbi:PQQ-binding-like beta-propeller repeat protein [Polymorphospora sp. NPDC050346]|uniref:outer membrane protein assembly factor BamB family protein n=1 Tax=Polymorphospora sp. NPDC050346 TaxID=3155780 RepID=UPI0033F6A5FD
MIFPDTVRESVHRIRRWALTAGTAAALVAAAPLPAVAAAPLPAVAAVSGTPERLPTFNGTVLATAYAGNTLYVGGDFTAATAGGKTVARSRLAAVDARTGALLDWAPPADDQVRAIAVAGGSVYVGGAFTRLAGADRDGLGRLDATTGAPHGTFRHRLTGQPYALAAANGRLYVGGTFTSVNGIPRVRLAAFDLGTGALLAGWSAGADATVRTVVAASGRIYAGGSFHRVNGAAGTARIAALDPASGALDTGFRPRASYVTHAIAAGPRGVYAAHGGPGGRIVAYDPTGNTRWTLTQDGDPQAVTVLDGTVYLGGHFDKVCRSPVTGNQGSCVDGSDRRVKLAAAAEADGTLLPWTADGNGISGVHAMAANPGLRKMVAGGAFTQINGTARQRLAQFG